MKKYLHIALLALVAAAMTACMGLSNKPNVDAKTLMGRWRAESQSTVDPANDNPALVFVFKSDTCIVDGMGYGYWGYQYDEGDGTVEADVLNDTHGNGWFGWTPQKGGIVLVNMLSVGRPKAPATNTVTAFSATSMTMTDAGKTYVFTKVGSK